MKFKILFLISVLSVVLIAILLSQESRFKSGLSDVRKPSGFFDFIFKKNEIENITLMKCANCKNPYSEPGTVQLESKTSCSSDRLYYQNNFEKISDVFKLKRNNFVEAHFADACVVHIMRSAGAYDSPSSSITQCESEDSAPIKVLSKKAECEDSSKNQSNECKKVKGHKLACVTSEYAYSTYNAFVDVMDCLAIPQRELLPKIWNESQFHVNIYGKGDDAGIGQLTGDAIQEVTKPKYADRDLLEIEYYKKEMEKADKPSCNRILAEKSAWKIVGSSPSVRCGLLTPESNPLRNILYTGIFYRVITSRITGIYYRAGKEFIRTPGGYIERRESENTPLMGSINELHIIEKMQTAGIENPNMDYLKQVLVSLAFNAGSSQAMKLFDNFLKSKIAHNLTIKEEDLDFINANSLRDMALLTAPDGETEESKVARLAQLEEVRNVAYERNLPQFLRLMQSGGAPGYVSKIAYRTTMLNREIGDGICTQPSFLQHSLVQASAQE